ARRTGHRHNNALLHALFADAANWRMVELTEVHFAGVSPAAAPVHADAGH
ncbi:MAG: hypothetical protein JNJ97_11345, partial [Alphaproteobacteria bacterium]|nr:hypothetical protein [Alphaproteobacteria bacterium]